MGTRDPGLRRLVLGTLFAAFGGHQAPDWALDLVAQGLAGHLLFSRNVADPGQVAALSSTLRSARPDVLIGMDEEGGDVTRLDHREGSRYPGNGALGAIGDPELTRAVYRAIGTDLAAVGVNLDLAPVVDVNTCDHTAVGTRSFGRDPDQVAAHAAAAVAGLREAGVLACAKHVPGYGATAVDSHRELPTLDASRQTLRTRYLPPFVAAIEAGTPAVMTAHIRVPELTGDDPATFSRRILVGLLRDELGFTGTIVTDALEMRGAVQATGGVAEGAVASLLAGADLLCIGSRVTAELVEQIVAAVVEAVSSGRLALARVEEAAVRVAALAGLSDLAALADLSTAAVPAGWGTALGLDVARRAITIEGTLPPLDDALVVQLESGSTIVEERAPRGLYPHLAALTSTGSLIRVPAGAATAADLHGTAAGRPIVIAGRGLHQVTNVADTITALASTDPVVVVDGLAVDVAPGRRTRVRHHVRREPGQWPSRRRSTGPTPRL